ncbi:PKD domain-containing protein [Synechococcus sp. PCC 7336]|uniref:PKD domain-containing protein n=1 Tax=Synechococcus sp. PCC 7336 TaxID=195250 RepID=UPI001D0D65B8
MAIDNVAILAEASTAPTAANDTISTSLDTPVAIDLLANDVDRDGSIDPTSLEIAVGPQFGSVEINADNTVTYTPNSNYTGFDEFIYIVRDDDGTLSNAAVATIEVINATPQIEDVLIGGQLQEGTALSFEAIATVAGNSNLTYLWDFGDGTAPVEGAAIAHTYSDNGNYTVTLSVTSDRGVTSTETLAIAINNAAPMAEAGQNLTVDEGSALAFNGSFTDPGLLDTHTIEWDFGDGTEVATGTLAPSHIYRNAGTYTVTLSVTDDDGGTGQTSFEVTVNRVAPTVEEFAGDTFGLEGGSFSFSGRATDAKPDSITYFLDFGDGTEPVANNAVEHIFKDDGTYTVTLTATNDAGLSTAQTLEIVVENVSPTITSFEAVDNGDNTATATFSAAAIDPGDDTLTYTWDFGDGTAAVEGIAASHTYTEPGSYEVTLTVTDEDGGITSQTIHTTLALTPAPELRSDFAVIAEKRLTINGGGDYDGDLLQTEDDARLYGGQGFTINGLPTLPILRDETGNPILDDRGQYILVDRAVSVGPNFSNINAPNHSPYGNLVPPRVVEEEIVEIPSYAEILNGELEQHLPSAAGEITIDPNKPPINNANDWNAHFPAAGTPEAPTVVRIERGGLRIPNGVEIRNTIIIVENGDINFNSNGHHLEGVMLVANNGSVNLANVQSLNLSVLASKSIRMNGGARFAGSTLLANGSDSGSITFNGATTSTGPEDNLVVISQSQMTFNGAADTRGAFLSRGNFTFNGNSQLVGSIRSKGNVTFNSGADLSFSRVEHNALPIPMVLRFEFSD